MDDKRRELNYKISLEPEVKKKAEILAEFAPGKFPKAGVKQIETRYPDIFVVYEDGKMLKNFQPYQENVSGIYQVNDELSYVICRDGKVETLYGDSDELFCAGKHDKVVFDDNFLAILDGAKLVVLSRDYEGFSESGRSVRAGYNNVKDVEIVHRWAEGEIPDHEGFETELRIIPDGSAVGLDGVPAVVMPRDEGE